MRITMRGTKAKLWDGLGKSSVSLMHPTLKRSDLTYKLLK